jgi:hypothetical protein
MKKRNYMSLITKLSFIYDIEKINWRIEKKNVLNSYGIIEKLGCKITYNFV